MVESELNNDQLTELKQKLNKFYDILWELSDDTEGQPSEEIEGELSEEIATSLRKLTQSINT